MICVLQKNISQWQQIKNRILALAMSNNLQHILIATYCSIVDWDGGVWWRGLGVHWQFTLSFPCDTELLPGHRPLGSLDSTSGLPSSPSGKELKWCGSYHLLWLGCRGSELPCTWFPELPRTCFGLLPQWKVSIFISGVLFAHFWFSWTHSCEKLTVLLLVRGAVIGHNTM